MNNINLITLNVKQRAIRCRYLDSGETVTLQTAVRDVVPGMVITVEPNKVWTFRKYPYMSGKVVDSRIDIEALQIKQLQLKKLGLWDPEEHYWGKENEPREAWVQAIIARGKRPEFEMEQVIPGEDPEDYDSDPITEAVELKHNGDHAGASKILEDTLEDDLRCIDAHAHLGSLSFDTWHRWALLHYEVGVRIGEHSLGKGFNGLLPWSWINNRPFLRCLHGYGLCLWKQKIFDEALDVFERILWLNPSDNQGVRFLVPDVKAKKAYEECCDK